MNAYNDADIMIFSGAIECFTKLLAMTEASYVEWGGDLLLTEPMGGRSRKQLSRAGSTVQLAVDRERKTENGACRLQKAVLKRVWNERLERFLAYIVPKRQ